MITINDLDKALQKLEEDIKTLADSPNLLERYCAKQSASASLDRLRRELQDIYLNSLRVE